MTAKILKFMVESAENHLSGMRLPGRLIAERAKAAHLFQPYGFVDTALTLAREAREYPNSISHALRLPENQPVVARAVRQLRLLGGDYQDVKLARIAYLLEDAAGLTHPPSDFARQANRILTRLAQPLRHLLPGRPGRNTAALRTANLAQGNGD